MNLENENNLSDCPRLEIVAYIDGELSLRDELELEIHFAGCRVCAEELNAQKKLLQALDLGFEKQEFEIPENFTKIVVANAESRVSGLRRPTERFNALFICAALFLLVLVGMGSDTEKVVEVFGKFFDQTLVIGSFIGHLAYNFAFGIIVILRTLCSNFVFKSALSVIAMLILFGLSALVFSRLLFRYHRI